MTKRAAPFVALLLLLLIPKESSAIRLRKCCPLGQRLDAELECTPTNATADQWIPADSFVVHSSSAVKISKQHVANTLRRIYNGARDIGAPACNPSSRDVAIAWRDPDIEDEFYLLYDGEDVLLNYYRKTVFHDSVTLTFRKSFAPETYCVDAGPDDTYLAVVCPCDGIACIRKCCHDNHVFDEDSRGCVDLQNAYGDEAYVYNHRDWRPTFENSTTPKENEYFLLSGVLPACLNEKGVYTEHEDNYTRFFYTADGSVKIESSNPSLVDGEELCGEWGWKKSRGTVENMIMKCFRKSKDEEMGDGQVRLPIYAPLLVFSALLLVASALVLAFDLNPDVEGRKVAKATLAHVSCLAVAHMIAVVAYSVNYTSIACVMSGYVMQFSFLAAFFWLNVMCFDMSLTFSGIRPPSGSQRDRDRKKFIYYSIYAWGCSSALTIIAIAVDVSPSVSENSIFKPNVGVIKCWFRDTGALWIYFYGPMAILLLMNLGLFIFTTYRIIVLKRGTKALHQENSARHSGNSPSSRDRQRFVLYAKLFSLMGITWLTEIISWAVGGPKYIWYFTDAVNLLRAVFIFIIFCWKPRVWMVIKKKMPCAIKIEQFLARFPCFNCAPEPQEESKTTSTTKVVEVELRQT